MKMPNTQPQEVNPVDIPQPQGQPVQKPDPTKGANEAASNLGFINTMQEHLIQYKGKQNDAKSPQNAPQQAPKEDKPTETKAEPNMAEEFTKFKTEIEGLMDSKLGDLKREIETALKDEPDEQKTETTKTA